MICDVMLSDLMCDDGLKTANYPNLQRTEIESYILNEFKIFLRYKNARQG